MSVDSNEMGLLQLGDMVRRNAARFGDKEAYIFHDQRLTWGQVEQMSNSLAIAFTRDEIGPKDKVAIFANNSHFWMLIEFALLKMGATVVVINVALKGKDLSHQFNHAEVKAVVTGEGMHSVVEEVRDEIIATHFYTWDKGVHVQGVKYIQDLLENESDEHFPLASVDPDDIAFLIFSSGTTGIPKGAVNTYWNILAKTIVFSFEEEFKEREVGLVITPLCMGGTQMMSVLCYAFLGMTCVIIEKFEPEKVLELIEKEKVNTMFAVPTMTAAIVRHPDIKIRNISSFKKIISAGAPLPLEIYRQVRDLGIGLFEGCGTSETGGGLMISGPEKEINPSSVGRPMIGFEVKIFNENDEELPVGEVGEIVMRGDSIAAGYYNQPEIEAEIYRNGWFHTGDLGRMDGNGYFYLVDRKKDMIISGGMNIYPKEIEEVLYEIPGVIECAVVGLPHDYWGEAVTAFIVKKPDIELDKERVLSVCRERLANYQVPKDVIFLNELPKTIFGKLYKIALRDEYAQLYR